MVLADDNVTTQPSLTETGNRNSGDNNTGFFGLLASQANAALSGAASSISNALSLNDVRNSTAQENLTFPTDLVSFENRYYIQFRFQKYQRRSVQDQMRMTTMKSPDGVGAIQLPIPENLVDQLSVHYEDTPTTGFMGAIVGAATEQLLRGRDVNGTTTSLVNNLSTSIKNVMDATASGAASSGVFSGLGAGLGAGYENLQAAYQSVRQQDVINGTETAANVLTAAGVQAVLNSSRVGSAISSMTGIASNPFMSVLFKNPQFKTHRFSWKLIPKSPKESDVIRRMIRTFQYHMLPTLSAQNYLLFGYPSIANITLFPSNTYLYKFKPCVVTSFSANYAGGGAPAFYRGAAPAVVVITVDLQEIEYWTAEMVANATGIRSAPPNQALSTAPIGTRQLYNEPIGPAVPDNQSVPDGPLYS